LEDLVVFRACLILTYLKEIHGCGAVDEPKTWGCSCKSEARLLNAPLLRGLSKWDG
jgi:hypothetical protein